MNLPIRRSEVFVVDVATQFAWYLEHANEEVAWRFVAAVDATLRSLATQPAQGRLRRFRHPRLQGIRSIGVAAPFERILLFYRQPPDCLQAWRLMPGSRDLPERLIE